MAALTYGPIHPDLSAVDMRDTKLTYGPIHPDLSAVDMRDTKLTYGPIHPDLSAVEKKERRAIADAMWDEPADDFSDDLSL